MNVTDIETSGRDTTHELTVVSGAVIASRLFDIADTIDLTKAEVLWGQQVRSAVSRGRLASTPPKAVAFGVPPLDIPLPPVSIRLDDIEIQATASARLYDFGLARLALRVTADDLPWSDFTRRLNAVDRVVGPAARNPVWTELLDQVRQIFAGALIRPSRSEWRRITSSAWCAPSTRLRTRKPCCE